MFARFKAININSMVEWYINGGPSPELINNNKNESWDENNLYYFIRTMTFYIQ